MEEKIQIVHLVFYFIQLGFKVCLFAGGKDYFFQGYFIRRALKKKKQDLVLHYELTYL